MEANLAPFDAPVFRSRGGAADAKKRSSPLYIGLGRFFSLILRHNRGVQEVSFVSGSG